MHIIHQQCKRCCAADSVNAPGASSDLSVERRAISQEWREPPDVALPGILACEFLLCSHITLKMNLFCYHITCGACQTCETCDDHFEPGKPPSLEDRYVTTCTLLAMHCISLKRLCKGARQSVIIM